MAGMSAEETIKTLQLKKEIDNLFESKINQESSEDASSIGSGEFNRTQIYNNDDNLLAFERQKAELKYHKKFKQVFDTLIERVDNNSSNSGSDESVYQQKNAQQQNKKRKFHDFVESHHRVIGGAASN